MVTWSPTDTSPHTTTTATSRAPGGILLDHITKFGPIAPDTVLQATVRAKRCVDNGMARRDQYMQNLSSRLPELHWMMSTG